MNSRQLRKLGFTSTHVLKVAQRACIDAAHAGQGRGEIRLALQRLMNSPELFRGDPIYGPLARVVARPAQTGEAATLREHLQYASWGDEIDPAAHEQMRNACRLPVSVVAALMPDAHVGYGLPIGGVLATENAVIPYAVGVDIACRVRMTVFDLPPETLGEDFHRYAGILERETKFGVGAGWSRRERPNHAVMDMDWSVSPITRAMKDKAWQQLGTSGSGNHFVEFGEVEFGPNSLGVPPRSYLAVVSHSGSRGTGAQVCAYYSRVARDLHRELPRELVHLAWLPMDGVGAEYWAAMELMGHYASANHEIIHSKISRAVGAPIVFQIENHHNFAWKERHAGREVIVHRKGATPAGRGVLGYIPGSMATPGFLVEGLGDPRSLNSASHGAGRCMSRTQAIRTLKPEDVEALLRARGVKLLSAGLDEAPVVYKDIEKVMQAQRELVRPIARFMPRLVKMAPAGERPED